MKMLPCLLFVCASTAFAQGKTDFTLNEGQVHFRVPPGWTAMMEKSDGNPQAVAFQVPDEAAQGSDDSASVTVKTRQLKSAMEFPTFAQDEFDHAKEQAGYQIDAANKNNQVHQYFVQRAQTRYVVRDHYYLSGVVAVEVRCQRPLLDKTTPAWVAQFESSCDSVAASLK